MAVKARCRWKKVKHWQKTPKPKLKKNLLTFTNTSKNYHELNVEFLCLKCIESNFPWI